VIPGKLPKWVAALPGLLLVTFFAGRAFVEMTLATRAMSPQQAFTPSTWHACVDTYAVTLSNSEFYVPEGQQFAPRQSKDISTVLSGMVRNGCGEQLKSVTIPITVHDDDGKRGEGTVTVSELYPGEVKSFSKAWMGRVTSYEIGKIR
jgi:hypothetical protein